MIEPNLTISGGEAILIVEDEASVRESIQLMLDSHGYTNISFANDADIALKILQKKVYPIIIIDIGLPGNINGLKLLEEIKELYDDEIEAIMLTAWGQTRYVIEAIKKGAFFYIIKEKEVKNLPAIIESAIKQSKKNRRLREIEADLEQKIDDIEELLRTDEKIYENELNTEYFKSILLEKVFEIFHNVEAAGITDTDEKIHVWQKKDESQMKIKEIKCPDCQDPTCFNFEDYAEKDFHVFTETKIEEFCQRVCREVRKDLCLAKAKSAISITLDTFVLDHFLSDKFNDLILKIKEKEISRKSIYNIWILFNDPIDGINEEQKDLFLNFFYKLGVALRNVYNQKQHLKKHIENEKYKKLEILTAGIPHDMTALLSKLTDNVNQNKKEYQKESLLILGKIKKLLNSYSDYRNSINTKLYNFESISLLDVLKDSIMTSYIVTEDENFEIKIDFDDGNRNTKDFLIKGDAIQLERAFRNLIINAKEAILAAKNIKRLKKGLIKIKVYKKNEFHEIMISDNGIGFPKDKTKKPFDDFFTTKREGLGMGLNIAFEAFKRHSGRLKVQQKKRGTELICTLPIN